MKRLLWIAIAFTAAYQPTPKERVYAEMRRQVGEFPAANHTSEAMVAVYVRDMLSPCALYHDHTLCCILILNGRVFNNADCTWRRGVLGESEAGKHIAMTARALTRAGPTAVGNLAYLHHAGASGSCVRDERDPRGEQQDFLPSTIAAKKHGPTYCGILVPNPYFLDYDHAKERDQRLARVAATPWARRDSRPFWRGKLRAPKRGCGKDSGNYARFLAMLLTVSHPRLFNIKANKIPMLAYGNASLLRSQACVDLDGLFGEHLPHVLANLDRALERAKDRYYKEQDYAKFKMLFHLPGGTTDLWGVGGLILYWDHLAYEHYTAGLEDGRTHLVVNVTSAKGAAERVLRDDALAERLRQGAADVQRDLVCAECLSDYLVETLRTLRSHFRGDLSLDSRENMRKTLKGVNCTAVGFREFVAGRKGAEPLPIPPAKTKPTSGEDPACLALLDVAFPP